MKAAVLTIGDELLIGQVVNTNASWMAEKLTESGVAVERVVATGDSAGAIAAELTRSASDAELILVTGGLGPTHDDITKDVVASLLGRDLEFNPEIYAEIVRRFTARGIPVAATNRGQAMVPKGFTVLSNPIGTAPGLDFTGELGGKLVRIILLPGVPREMKRLMEDHVLPTLAGSTQVRRICQKTLLSTGIGESNLNEIIGDLTSFLDDNLKLAFLPSETGVRLRITAHAADDNTARTKLEAFEKILLEKAEKYIFGEGDETLEAIVGGMLTRSGQTIACAESCTGGLLASRLTDIAGSSVYVKGAVVAYSNEVKVSELGVNEDDLKEHGAVSRPVATQMAIGVRQKFGVDIGVSTSGIMGPDGGTEKKPVGTVWIGYADKDAEGAVLLRLTNERLVNKARAATAALNMVRLRLLRDG